MADRTIPRFALARNKQEMSYVTCMKVESTTLHLHAKHLRPKDIHIPVDISGTVGGESPDYLLLFGTVVGENLDHVCWD